MAVTLNPADSSANVTLSNGNLSATANSASIGAVRATTSRTTTGKFYWEVKLTGISGGANNGIGVGNASATLADFLGQDINGYALYPSGNFYNNNTLVKALLPSPANPIINNWIGVAVDVPNQLIWYINITRGGGWNTGNAGTPDPATGVGGQTLANITTFFPMLSMSKPSGTADSFDVNFGATAFAGSVPTGFSAAETSHPVAKITRLSLDGYGVRRYRTNAFAGKTAGTPSAGGPPKFEGFRRNVGRMMR